MPVSAGSPSREPLEIILAGCYVIPVNQPTMWKD